MQHRSQSTHVAAPPERAESHGLREAIGAAIGWWWAPAIAAIARVREARMFHPTGHTFAGRVEPIIGGNFDTLGRALDGRVLVRVSGALWKRERERFDVLGVGMRVRPGRGADLDAAPAPGDQDLLFATIRSPFTMLASPFTTDATTFLQRYWAVAPFASPAGRVELRLTPIGSAAIGGSRIARLREAIKRAEAGWWLEAKPTLTLVWHRVAHVFLEHEVAVDQAALAFDPFRTGAGLEPVGLVHAIRRAAYAASRGARHLVGG